MSSAMLSTAAAQSRLFAFDADVNPDVRSDVHCNVRSVPDRREHAGALVRILESTIKNQKSTILASITPASHLGIRPAPEMISSGIAAINALTGGWPRGCLTEICGPASSGRTTVLLAALAAATRRGEFCVLVDASDALDPHSAADAGVALDRLLWVRCGEDSPKPRIRQKGCPISRVPSAREVGMREVGARETEPVAWVVVGGTSQNVFDSDGTGLKQNELKKNEWKKNWSKKNDSRQSERHLEQVLHATDLLLESGGFGLVVLDLSDLPPQHARRIPLTTWFRFRRAIEHTPTVLLAIEQQPIAGSCSSLQIKLGSEANQKLPVSDQNLPATENATAQPADFPCPTHAQLLTGLEITAELMCSRLERKPVNSASTFASKTAWAG